MSSTQNDALLATKRRIRDRRSIAHISSATGDFMDRDNATTTILPNKGSEENGDVARNRAKRPRSLSLGPGGIEALREDAGNKQKMPLAPTRSILKPTVRISPLKQIPTRKKPKPTTASQSKDQSPWRNSPLKSPSKLSPSKILDVSSSKTHDAEKPKDTVDAEEQAKCEKEEEVRKHREARRKSLAARRVSFAAEATLHTWEDIQDSTASTVSTEHTSKADSTIAQHGISTKDKPDEVLVSRSPDEGKRRRRRSSVIPPINFNNPDDDFSSSSSSASSDSGDENVPDMQSNEDDTMISGSESGDDEIPGEVSNDSENQPGIHEAPQVLQSEARDQKLSFQEPNNTSPMEAVSDGETGDISMDLAGDDITAAFKPWAQRIVETARSIEEKANPFSPAFKIATYPTLPSAPEQEDDDGMSMDMTKAVGGILETMSSMSQVQNVKTSSPVRRSRRRSSASSTGGETMEFTTVIGGIQASSARSPDRSFIDENEDLSMEFTSVFGGIQARQARQPTRNVTSVLTSSAEEEANDMDGDGDMEMTTALGGILRSASELQTIDEDDETNEDVTMAFDGITQQSKGNDSRTLNDFAGVPDEVTKPRLRSASARKTRLSMGATATGSPMVFDSPSSRSREVMKNRQTSTPSKAARITSSISTPVSDKSKLGKIPAKRTTTPQKQMTPQGVRPTTPGKTPLSTNLTMRIASPKRLFQDELVNSSKPSGHGFTESSGLASTAVQPSLTNKMVSGLNGPGIRLGSPKLAALLDRRVSIGDRADVFVAQTYADRGVRFEDPRALYIQVSKEQEEDERRESGQFILEQEADAEMEDRDSITTLKERIESMTPKKNKLKGRKSLAPGGAKGLLGKRPLELDEEDEDGTPLALKHRSMTPVKKIKLTGPPSKQETTGRQPPSTRQTLGGISANDRLTTPSLESPSNLQTATTPKSQGRFKDAEALPSARKPLPTLGKEVELDKAELNETPDAKENIQLQDFLNMTSIRFMELNTTKRRHTIAPGIGSTALTEEGEVDQDKLFEEAVVAGACTVPMLELFQHSCRELKKYISEGRDIVREIEVDTFEENPPLFQEYMSASPAERTIMDTQFKNMKTHARLTSKGMWYEWRMKLLEGLKIGLAQVSEGMMKDDEVLSAQESQLENTLSPLLQQHESLTNECMDLQSKVDAVPEDEREELDAVREQLVAIDSEIEEKRKRVLEFQKGLHTMDTAIQNVAEVREECIAAVKKSQKLCEECRGWTASEVALLKAKVTNMESTTKWLIASATSSNLTMVYNQQLQLFFDVASFLPFAGSITKTEDSPISLTYVGDTADRHPLPLTTEKRFFLQLMRAHLQCLGQHQTDIKDLLNFVSTGWNSALAVVDEIHQLNRICVTNCSIMSDERLEVKAMMLLPELRTKVTIGFEVGAAAEAQGVKCRITPRVDVAYGEPFKSNKMAEFLKEKVVKDVGTGSWARTFKDLKGRLLVRGKK